MGLRRTTLCRFREMVFHQGHHCRTSWVLIGALVLGVSGPVLAVENSRPVDYSLDVRPLLARHCFACHGPDEASREGDLRLDAREFVVSRSPDDGRPVVAGHPDQSTLWTRITTTDPDLRMPPPDSGPPLTAAQQATLRRWIAEGARFTEHWSFRPLQVEPLPTSGTAWARSPIDRWIASGLEREGFTPSPEADRPTLIRRLYLDLLGLSPDPAEVAQFLADDSPTAYERLVDRVLASPHFGERWGRHWLDLAHYADSDGYLGDSLRPNAWLYRDWVVRALNDDLPFDSFTIQQLAGDLWPGATRQEQMATGFLRTTLRNTEAGVDLEEYRLKEVVDRVNTLGITWLGLSLGCAECHSHKLDPISQREFYELFAFFNDADDVDLPHPLPADTAAYEARRAPWESREQQLAAEVRELWTKEFGAGGTPAAGSASGSNSSKPATSAAEGAVATERVDLADILKVLAVAEKKRSAAQKKLLDGIRPQVSAALAAALQSYEQHQAARPLPPDTKVMSVAHRRELRSTYVHQRGDYRSRGEEVQPGTLKILPPLPRGDSRATRLELARWLIGPAHFLSARVTVNQFWRYLFGQGIVASVDNFGAGGDPPSHPELLDWLASEFAGRGWSRKELVRRIVCSTTYRQASAGRPELAQRDPLNRWLARQGRWRVEAEVVRDVGLAAGGLLERRFGGPGIRPPQPEYITSISRNVEWNVSTGGDRYRRGLYILFRRATPYPMLLTFDAPDSTAVCPRRERSNSPLQALTLLNDPVFFECARGLAATVSTPTLAEEPGRHLQTAVLRCLGREATPAELARIQSLWEAEQHRAAGDPAAAKAMLGGTEVAGVSPAAQAALVVAARVLMNLDEFVTRE